MAWDDFGIYKLGPQSVQELHLNNVYKDPEFADAVEAIFPNHRAFMQKLRLVSTEQQVNMLNTLDKIDKGSLHSVARSFAMNDSDVYFYLSGRSDLGISPDYKQPFVMKWDDDGKYTVSFRKDITKEDFMQIWKILDFHNGRASSSRKKSRNRLPKHDRLLYAIFKARQRHVTFSAIYDLYKEKQLPYYDGEAPTEFNAPEKLAEYYRKYKPNTGLN